MLLFLDIETTGFEKSTDEILEIAAVRWDGDKIIDRFECLLRLPEGKKISADITNLTGITQEMCQNDGLALEDAQEKFLKFFLNDDIVTGHNIQFDTGFLLEKNFLKTPPEEIDTFLLSLLVLGQKEESHSLEILSEKFGLTHENAHRAMSDVEANLDFYTILQKIYAKNFSDHFQKFITEQNFSLPEKKFFDDVKENIETLQAEKFPFAFSSLPVPHFTSEKKADTEFFQEIFTENKSVFFECQDEEKYLENILEGIQHSSENSDEKFAIFYPNNRKKEFFALLESYRESALCMPDQPQTIADTVEHNSLKGQLDLFSIESTKNSSISMSQAGNSRLRGTDTLSVSQNLDISQINDTSVIHFDIASTEKISPEKWEKFLKKKDFSRQESIVATKFFRAKEMGEEKFLRFMGPEWKAAREIQGTPPLLPSISKGSDGNFGERNYREFEESIGDKILILPLSESPNIPNTYHKIFFGSHHLEDTLREMQTEKFFQKRLREDLPEKSESEKNRKKFFLTLLGNFAQELRKIKGENKYAVKILLRDAKQMPVFPTFLSGIQNFFSEEKENFSTLEKNIIEPWKIFFENENPKSVQVIELYSDNLLAIEQINPRFEDAFQSMISLEKSNIFLGTSFPKNSSRSLRWSFDLSEDWENFSEEKDFPEKILVPDLLRDSTPRELCAYIKKYWETHDIVVSVTSMKTTDTILEVLREEGKEKNISFFSRKNGGTGKITNTMNRISQGGRKIIIGNAKFLDGFDLLSLGFSVHIIHKFLFDHHKQPLIAAQREKFIPQDFYEYSLPRVATRLEHEVLRLGSVPENICIFGDGRLLEDSTYHSTLQSVFPERVEIERM